MKTIWKERLTVGKFRYYYLFSEYNNDFYLILSEHTIPGLTRIFGYGRFDDVWYNIDRDFSCLYLGTSFIKARVKAQKILSII